MTRRRTWAIAALTAAVALSLAGIAARADAATPGNPEAGQKIFKDFCARCHNFMANGTHARRSAA